MLEQVSGVIRTIQTSMMVLLVKIISNIKLKTLTILTKTLILDSRLGPGRTSAYRYIAVVKIQTKTCKDERQVKMESI